MPIPTFANVSAGTEQQYEQYRKLARDRQRAEVAAAVDEEASDPRGWSLWGLWP
jgi:hypothetical protein